MKKLLFAVLALVAVSLSSCGGSCEKSDANDSTALDSVDTVQVDTIVADSVVAPDVE